MPDANRQDDERDDFQRGAFIGKIAELLAEVVESPDERSYPEVVLPRPTGLEHRDNDGLSELPAAHESLCVGASAASGAVGALDESPAPPPPLSPKRIVRETWPRPPTPPAALLMALPAALAAAEPAEAAPPPKAPMAMDTNDSPKVNRGDPPMRFVNSAGSFRTR